ncbi:MAG: hypothetical protein J7496_03350 [Novosphingobium sp.]|nr:hypothetical protein [Novosphingobium sp.]MBO9601527.1 hypothetical protein [Novosphingobium sp.]
MNTYQLVFTADGRGEAKVIEFDAEDAAEALIVAHSEAPGRNAELWRDDEMLCAIRRREVGYWELGHSAQAAGNPAPQ